LLSLLALFLGGCASNPADRDISGTWINQAAIDAAPRRPLREALQAYGPNLEWNVNTKAGQARYTNGLKTSKASCWANSPAPGKSTSMAARPAS
jgi:hypothetical protein